MSADPPLSLQVDEIRRILRDDLRQKIYEIEDADATLDGGDVLFTGKDGETSKGCDFTDFEG